MACPWSATARTSCRPSIRGAAVCRWTAGWTRRRAVAALLRAQWGAGLGGGVVVANPIAAEHELPRERMELIIAQALQDAQRRGVLGKDVTPFLLGRVVELSDGASLRANIELMLANARLAAQIAVALADRS
jgi:pseudouridine-5'-phosphate glycosidase